MTLRTFVSAVGVILALVLTAVAVPAAWVDQNIVQEDGFARIAGGLGSDPDFQARLADAAVGSFESSVNLPGPIKSLAAGVLEQAASGMQSWSDYPQAWEETVRNSHRLNFRAAGQREESGASTALVLDIGPLVRLIRDHFADATRVRLEVPSERLISLGEPSHRQLVERVAAFAPLWWVAALGALVSALLALLVARRRPAVLAFLGLGGLAVAGLWSVGLNVSEGVVGNLSNGNELAGLFMGKFFTAVQSGFGPWTTVAALISAALLVIGLVAWIISARRPSPYARG
jgi:hypothetical protein